MSEKFRENLLLLVGFAKELVEWANGEGHVTIVTPLILDFAALALKNLNKDDIIHTFIIKSYDHWDKVKERDENFLMSQCDVLFADLGPEYVNDLNKLFAKKNEDGSFFVPPQTRDSLWEMLHEMICCCIRHIHIMREPASVTDPKIVNGKEITSGYSKQYPNFPEGVVRNISVRLNVEKFQVKLI